MERIINLKQNIKVVSTGNDFEILFKWRKYLVTEGLATFSIDPNAAWSGI
jgi:hypothetical protein